VEQQLLTRLVALNHERAAEEKRGLIRWLRPDFQAPASGDGHNRSEAETEPLVPVEALCGSGKSAPRQVHAVR
jgi:hypothetical protein